MYAYNVFADKTPTGYGCEASEKTACYVLVVGGDEPYIINLVLIKWKSLIDGVEFKST